MWTNVMLLTCLMVDTAACNRGGVKATVGQATGDLLVTAAERSCSLVIITDSQNDTTLILQEVLDMWRRRRQGMAMFQVVTGGWNTNVTHLLVQLVPLARRVRQLSWCTMVVVVSHDLAFLAAFAEWSLRGRLLVWSTRLFVVTRLALRQLRALLPHHWTFSMMNALFLNVEDTSSSFQVFSYLPYGPAGPQVAQVASWTHSRGLVLTEGHTLFEEKFSNFYGARVNVTSLPFAPYWEERQGPNNTIVYSGTDYYTLAAIADALNFTAHVVPTSSWAEVTRLVEERVSFMAPVIHNVMPHRRERYDFSFVYEYVSMDFSMAPPGLRAQWKALYYPLSASVWLATLISLLLVPLVFYLAMRAASDKVSSLGNFGLDAGAVYQDMTGMLLGQNLPRRLPSTSSSRLLVAVWLVFGIIFASAYRGNLTASLTLPTYPPRPETVPQLVESVRMITMQSYGRDFKEFFSKSESPLFQKLAALINIVPTLMVGQQQAIENNQAHLDNRRYQHHNIAKRFTRADGSELLYIGRESIMPGQSAWPLPHDAPYTAVIDRHLMAVVESLGNEEILQAGLYEKWAADLLFEVQQGSRKQQQQQQQQQLQQQNEGKLASERSRESTLSLSIRHTQGAFMLFMLGLVVAALAFGGEVISGKL